MLWFKKQPDALSASGAGETVAPVALAVELDERIFAQKFAALLEMIGETGGVDVFLQALETKTRLFQGLLDPAAVRNLDLDKLEILLETVMPARKRLWPALSAMGAARAAQAIEALLYGKAPLEERLGAFVEAVPVDAETDAKAAKKLRRAAHDFAAELLHFRAPERYPLMTKWVWDQATHSGALRELAKGGDTLNTVPLGTSPGVYEAGRQWIAERMAEQGVYRAPHYTVDVFLAHAYADYMKAMSSGMGLLNADFGGSADPMEIVKKLLGVDHARRKESRVKKAERANGNS